MSSVLPESGLGARASVVVRGGEYAKGGRERRVLDGQLCEGKE